jgi:hypothetical protein
VSLLVCVKRREELRFVVGVQRQEVPGPFAPRAKKGDDSTGRPNFGSFLAPFQRDPPTSQSIVSSSSDVPRRRQVLRRTWICRRRPGSRSTWTFHCVQRWRQFDRSVKLWNFSRSFSARSSRQSEHCMWNSSIPASLSYCAQQACAKMPYAVCFPPPS